MKRAYNLLPGLSLILLTLLLFNKALTNPFFQDDYLLLWLGWLKKSSDFWQFFAFVPHFPYRPIAIHLFGALVVHGFGMNAFYSHMLLFGLHLFNTLLVWHFIRLLTKRRTTAYIGGVIYAVSTAQFIPLFWWATVYMVLGTTFTLLLTIVLLGEQRSMRTIIVSSLLFLLMLITNESLFVFPVFYLIYLLIIKPKNPISPWPFFLIAGIFIVIKMRYGAYPVSGDYAIGTVPQIIATIKWYLLRAVNISEGVRQMPRLMKLLTTFLLSLWGSMWLFRVVKHRLSIFRMGLLGLSWFFIFCGPFFLLVFHASPYYLNTALVGVALCVAIGWSYRSNNSIFEKMITVVWLSLYVGVSFININYLQKTHWVVWRADVAQQYINRVQMMYPHLPKNATVVFINTKVDPSEISIALSGEKALQLWYHDPTLRVVYGDEIDGYIVTD